MRSWIFAAAIALITCPAAAEFRADATLEQVDDYTKTIRLKDLAVGESLIATFPFCTSSGELKVNELTEAEEEKTAYMARFRVKRIPGNSVEVTVVYDGDTATLPREKRKALLRVIEYSVNPSYACRFSAYSVDNINGFKSTLEILRHFQAP